MSFSMNAMMSSMLVETRGSISGFMQPMAARSRSACSLMRFESASGSSPFSCARLTILSSTSVTLRQYVTSKPRARRKRDSTSNVVFVRA